MNRPTCLKIAAALTCTLAAATANAQPTPAAEARQQALNDLECRTLLRLGGEERDFTLLYLHGFVSGRTQQLLLPVKDLAEATDQLIERCIDKPNDKALAVLEQLRAARK